MFEVPIQTSAMAMAITIMPMFEGADVWIGTSNIRTIQTLAANVQTDIADEGKKASHRQGKRILIMANLTPLGK